MIAVAFAFLLHSDGVFKVEGFGIMLVIFGVGQLGRHHGDSGLDFSFSFIPLKLWVLYNA